MYAVTDDRAGVAEGSAPRLDDRTFSVPDGDLLALWRAERESIADRRRSRERLKVADLRRCRVRIWPKAREATITSWRGRKPEDAADAEQLQLARAIRGAVA